MRLLAEQPEVSPGPLAVLMLLALRVALVLHTPLPP